MDKNTFILGTRNTSANQYSVRDTELMQDRVAEQNGPSPKRAKLEGHQLSNSKLKLDDNFVQTISRLRSLGSLYNEFTMPNKVTSTHITKSPAEEVNRFESSHQQNNPQEITQNNYSNIGNQFHHNANNLPQNSVETSNIYRYPQLQKMQEILNKARVSLYETASQNMRKTLHMAHKPVILANQIINNIQPSGDKLSAVDPINLQNMTNDQEIQNKVLPDTQTFHGNPQTQTQNSFVVSNTPFVIQNTGNGANQSSHVPRPSLVHQTRTYEMTNTNTAKCQNLSGQMIINGSNNMNYIKQSVISGHGLVKESSSVPNTSFLQQVELIQGSTEEPPMIYEFTPTIITLPDNQQNSKEVPQTKDIIEEDSQAVDSGINKADVWMDQIAKHFQMVNSDFVQASNMAHELHLSLARSAKMVGLIANVFENLRGVIKNQVTAATNTEAILAVPKTVEEKPAEAKEVEVEHHVVNNAKDKVKHDKKSVKIKDDDDESSSDSCVADKGDEKESTRGVTKTFVLPPEYDPHDTRWTLKYREYDRNLGIEELVPRSKVYINSIKLSHCKQISKDCKTLARMLLVEIFTRSALSVCSLTGVKSNAFDPTGDNIRPGLDENARQTIMKFVEKYGLQNNWGKFDAQTVTNSIRSKIQEVRAKAKYNM